MELFRAFSVRENYKDRDTVIVDWFCAKREKPQAPLEDLVENLDLLSQAEKEEAGIKLGRLLSADEIDQLEIYIRATTGFEVKRAEVKIPLADGRKAPDFSGLSTNGEGEYFHIHKSQDYNLSTQVSGFVDLSEPPNTRSAI